MGLLTLKSLILSIKGFNEDEVNMRANSLTYSFMFALVPILAMMIAVARGFGFESVIENYLNSSFLSNYNIVPTIMEFVQKYLETAKGGVFIGIGIFILLWAIYSFFRNVEMSFNAIWQVEKSRQIITQLTSYITILMAVPILMIASSGISITVNTTIDGLERLSTLNQYLLRLVPWLSSWLIFTIMYWLIPNTKVHFTSALIPGILIGTIVQILQMASVYIILFLGRTSVVYGTFAAIPLLLTWVQWTCLAILFGAELSYSIQNSEVFDYKSDLDKMSRRYKDYLTLYICYLVVRRFENGDTPLSAHAIAQEQHLPLRMVNNLLMRLVESHLLIEVHPASEKEEATFLPAMDINKITVGMVIEHIEQQGEEQFLRKLPNELNEFWNTWTNIRQQTADSNHLLVKDLVPVQPTIEE